MNVLITGGSGLVGSAIKNIINSSEYNYVFLSSKDCDLKNDKCVEELFQKYKPVIVIHLAAIVGGLYNNIDNNYDFLIGNIKINTNILECCNKYNVKRLINILSTCVFGNDLVYPLTSNQILDGQPDNSNIGYSHAKRILHIGSKLLCNKSDIEIINLIPTNLYGENDNYNLNKSHVIPGLIHKFHIYKNKLIIKGSGKALREFMYVDDFAKIIIHFITCKLEERFNALIVSPPRDTEITIKELVGMLSGIFDYKGEITYDTGFSDGQPFKTTDSIELEKYIPNFKFTELQNGLQKTIKYFKKNYDEIRK